MHLSFIYVSFLCISRIGIFVEIPMPLASSRFYLRLSSDLSNRKPNLIFISSSLVDVFFLC